MDEYSEEEKKEFAKKYDEDKEEVEVQKIEGKPKNSTAAMFTSYTKDIFCKLDMDGAHPPTHNMELAIELVKQAKEAFE